MEESPYSYSWDSGQDSPALINVDEGTYILSVEDACDSVLTDTVTLIVSNQSPLAVVGKDSSVCYGEEMGLGPLIKASGGLLMPDMYIVSPSFFSSEIYSLSRQELSLPTLIGTSVSGQIYAGDFALGTFYCLNNETGGLVSIDIATGTTSGIGVPAKPSNHTWTGLAFDQTDSTMYAISTKIVWPPVPEVNLYSIDLTTGNSTFLHALDQRGIYDPFWMAIDTSGTIYIYDVVPAAIFSIDKTSGTPTYIGNIGVELDDGYISDADFDPQTNLLYFGIRTEGNPKTELRVADLNVGGSFLLANLTVFLTSCGALAIPDASEFPQPEYQYSWTPSDHLSSATSSNPVFQHDFNMDTTISYTVTVHDDCQPISTTIQVHASVVTGSGSSTSAYGMGGNGTAMVIPAGGTPPYTYDWSTGESTETIVDLDSGTYSVVITDANDCSDTVNVQVEMAPVSIEKETGFAMVEVYPNPVYSHLSIHIEP